MQISKRDTQVQESFTTVKYLSKRRNSKRKIYMIMMKL